MALSIDRFSRSKRNRFTSVRLDRLVERRDDAEWFAAALTVTDAHYVPTVAQPQPSGKHRDGTLAVYLRPGELDELDLIQPPTLLGTDDKRTYLRRLRH